MYTAQIDRHGNIIVCKDSVKRSGYVIFFTGTYNECLNRKTRFNKQITPFKPSRANPF
jgi:hypothetical protein